MATKVRTIKASELSPDLDNANAGTERGLRMLDDSLREDGAGRSILVDRHGKVIAGNKTLERAVDIGLDDVIVVETDGTQLVAVQRKDLDLSEPGGPARRLAYRDNRTGELDLAWNLEQLQRDQEAMPDLLADLWRPDELEELLASLAPPPVLNGDPDEIPPSAPARCQRGQIWEIAGRHRLMCGDSTNVEDVARLMGGERAGLLVTDPPYAVDYVEKARDMNRRGYVHSRATLGAAIVGDDIDAGQEETLWRDAFTVAYTTAVRKEAAAYVWHGQGRATLAMLTLLADLGFLHHQTIIWTKPNFVIGRCDYQWKHEPCFYGWKQGHRPPFYGERNQTTVWSVARDTQHPDHPTQKPVAIFTPPMTNHLKRGEAAYDPFLGSGTTLVAAEQTGRRAFGMEISAKYCDIALERAIRLGLTARKVEG